MEKTDSSVHCMMWTYWLHILGYILYCIYVTRSVTGITFSADACLTSFLVLPVQLRRRHTMCLPSENCWAAEMLSKAPQSSIFKALCVCGSRWPCYYSIAFSMQHGGCMKNTQLVHTMLKSVSYADCHLLFPSFPV